MPHILHFLVFLGAANWLLGQGVIDIQGIDFTIPSSGNNGSRDGTSAGQAFIDDVFLDKITIFDGTGFVEFVVADGDVILGQSAIVRSGAAYVNAEFGDLDDGSDGNPNPFVEIGVVAEGAPVSEAISDSTDPSIQNPSISAAVSSLSLVQGIDGEGPPFTFDVIFESGILDNDYGVDAIPEFVLLERGFNSPYSLRAIIGGTLANPIYSSLVDVPVSAQQATGIWTNTNEIGAAQQLASYGVDASSFGIASGTAIYGLSITSTGGGGADISAQFITAQNDWQIVTQLPSLPEPSVMVLFCVGFVATLRRQR